MANGTNNNLYELKFLREQLDLNISIKNFQLKAIKLNENLYEIIFFGDFELFKKSNYRSSFK